MGKYDMKFANNELHKVLFISIPKCGTHVGLKLLDAAGFGFIGYPGALQPSDDLVSYLYALRPGTYNAWHFFWTEELSNIIQSHEIKIVFLYRDPRAQLTSNMHFIKKTSQHPLHDYFTKFLKSDEERIIALLIGFTEYLGPLKKSLVDAGIGPYSKLPGGLNNLYRVFSRWLTEPNTITVRFEDIIGSRGGGSDHAQCKTIHEILSFIGVSSSDSMVETLCSTLYDRNSITFNKGRIDSWKEDFTPRIEELFRRECSELMALWGYKLNDNEEPNDDEL
jgi:hypothetical protein